MNPNLTDVTIILDRSQSMLSIKQATEDGLREYIGAMRAGSANHQELLARRRVIRPNDEAPLETRVTLVQFDSDNRNVPDIHTVFSNLPPEMVPVIVLEPRGGTPMLEAIGRTIIARGEYFASLPEEQRPGTVLIVIDTDGDENTSSGIYNRNQSEGAAPGRTGYDVVGEMIQHQTDVYKWEFLYLGANQDAIRNARRINIQPTQAMNYTADAIHTNNMFAAAARGTSELRGGKLLDVGAKYVVTNDDRLMSGDPTAVPNPPDAQQWAAPKQ